MVHSSTRRCLLHRSALATLGITGNLPGQIRAADTAGDAFAFPLLGDLHADKLEHHSMEGLQKHVNGEKVSAEMYAGTSRKPWHIVEMSKA